MKVIKLVYGLIIVVFTMCACSVPPDQTVASESYFPSDTVVVENNYPALTDSSVLEAIQTLNICSLSDTNTVLEPCDYKKFRVFPLAPETPFSKGFLLEMREGVYNAPMKQLVIIEKSFNKWQMVNRYFGFLVEYRTRENVYNDLLIGYKDPEMGIIAMRHEWQGEKYEPVDVEEINGYFIKESLKDSINNLFISSFNAGY